MCTGIDGHSLHVQQAPGRPPCDGTAYVCAKAGMGIDTSQIIIDRCNELGISHETARMIGKESGYSDTSAVCWAIGLDPVTMQPLWPRNWILMAAQTSSVSCRTKMPEEALIAILASAEISSAFTARVDHLLDEAPAQILIMAAEQAVLQASRPIAAILANISNVAKTTNSLCPGAWEAQR